MPRRNTQVDKIQKEVGLMMQKLRIAAGQSRHTVASAIGVAGSQLEKYEKGKNLISLGRLIALAEHFNTSVSAILDDLGVPNRISVPKEQRLSLELMRNFQMIKSPQHRYAVQQLVKNLAEED